MRHGWLRRNWLWVWLVLLGLLLAAAPVKRDLELRALNRRLIAQLRHRAEHGYPVGQGLQPYLWDFSVGGAQGPAVYLLKRGYRDPELLRLMLLTEAQRLYDWIYTYPSVRNYDLRRMLIASSLKAYPDDLKVAWATGVLDLAAGDDAEACEQLGRVIDAVGVGEGLNRFAADQGIDPRHLLGRWCAALTLNGRDAELGARLAQWHEAEPGSLPVLYCYANWLNDSGHHAELLVLLAPGSAAYTALGETAVRLRKAGLFWSGDLTGYRLAAANTPAALDLARLKLAGLSDLGFLTAEDETNYELEFWACADLYGVTHDAKYLAPLEAAVQDFHTTHGIACARAYALTDQWRKAYEICDDLTYNLYSFHTQLVEVDPFAGYLAILLQARLSQLVPLTLQLPPLEAREFNLDGTLGKPIELDPAVNTYWRFFELRDRDLLIAVMRSPQFAAAVKCSGRSVADVLPELRDATRPERGNYHDSSNGGLDGE